MVSSNILKRTFNVQYGKGTGTCFTIDHEGKQYIVTAKHVVEGFGSKDSLSIFHERKWKKLSCDLVGLGEGDIDIAVLASSYQISPALVLPATAGNMILGQDVYFLGFPYGLRSEIGALNSDFPLPLVKKACVSSFNFGTAKMDYMLLDGHNNPGFSGGPVVYHTPWNYNPQDPVKVAGVISSYRFEWDAVFLKGQQTPLEYRYNTGLIVAFSINHAIELITANPIGVRVK